MNKIGKNKKNKGFVVVGNKKYPYSIEDLGLVDGEKTVFFDCKDAKISQEFLAEDVSGLLIDLPELILSEKDYSKKQSEVIRFRVSSEDKAKIEKRALVEGFSSVSNYLREVALRKTDQVNKTYVLFSEEKEDGIPSAKWMTDGLIDNKIKEKTLNIK